MDFIENVNIARRQGEEKGEIREVALLDKIVCRTAN